MDEPGGVILAHVMGMRKTLTQMLGTDIMLPTYCFLFCSTDGPEDMDEPGGVILAHVMGLGKTLTTIAFLHTYLSIPPAQEGKARLVLVVVPANVLHNFFGEVSE